jgi:hypothetical protein
MRAARDFALLQLEERYRLERKNERTELSMNQVRNSLERTILFHSVRQKRQEALERIHCRNYATHYQDARCIYSLDPTLVKTTFMAEHRRGRSVMPSLSLSLRQLCVFFVGLCFNALVCLSVFGRLATNLHIV